MKTIELIIENKSPEELRDMDEKYDKCFQDALKEKLNMEEPV